MKFNKCYNCVFQPSKYHYNLMFSWKPAICKCNHPLVFYPLHWHMWLADFFFSLISVSLGSLYFVISQNIYHIILCHSIFLWSTSYFLVSPTPTFLSNAFFCQILRYLLCAHLFATSHLCTFSLSTGWLTACIWKYTEGTCTWMLRIWFYCSWKYHVTSIYD